MTTITSTGDTITINRNGKPISYSKGSISIKTKDGSYLRIDFEGKEVFYVRESERGLVTPSSTSLLDLQGKILALFPSEADQAVLLAIMAHKGDTYWVNTKAEAVAFAATPNLNYCQIYVLIDESFGSGLGVYLWNKVVLSQFLTWAI